MKSFRKPVLLATAISLALFANATQKTDKIDTSKWQTFSSKNGDYKVKTPEGWAIADPKDPAYIEGIDKIKKNNPGMLASIPAGADQYDLFLFDFTNLTGTGISNLNMKSLKDSGLTQQMYPDVAKEIIKQAKLKKSGWKTLDLPCGKSVSYWGVLTVALGEGKSMDMNSLGFMTVKGNMVYITTLVTSGDLDKAQKATFDTIAQTITLK